MIPEVHFRNNPGYVEDEEQTSRRAGMGWPHADSY